MIEHSEMKKDAHVSARSNGFIQPNVSIQGYEGSFHQAAARHYFGKDVKVLPCSTFGELIKVASNPAISTGGVMAIENSIAGSILANYNLLQKSDLTITGEVYLQIKQNLMVNPGVKLEDIREVHSHPMALQQCLEYLDSHNWKLVETEDTALSAKHIHQHKSRHIAAIASRLAADLYDLEVIAPNIHTLRNNYTRFLVLSPSMNTAVAEGANKASVNFRTDHSKGSLAKVLVKIAEEDINLSKLQSFPIPGSNWQYSFHADMEFERVVQFEDVVSALKGVTEAFRVYGVYKKGETY